MSLFHVTSKDSGAGSASSNLVIPTNIYMRATSPGSLFLFVVRSYSDTNTLQSDNLRFQRMLCWCAPRRGLTSGSSLGRFEMCQKSKKPQPFQETTIKHSLFRLRLTQAANLRSTPSKACLFLAVLKGSTPTTAQPSERLNRETSSRARNISKALGAIRHKVPSFISTLISLVKTPPPLLVALSKTREIIHNLQN